MDGVSSQRNRSERSEASRNLHMYHPQYIFTISIIDFYQNQSLNASEVSPRLNQNIRSGPIFPILELLSKTLLIA